jgi:ubiquinol-cytochrome c reductase cytochrome c subunit
MTPFLLATAVALLATVTLGAQTARQPAPPTPQPAPAPDIAGKAAYMKNGCWQCHGQQGQGGAAGPRLGPRPMPVPAFRAYVRKPLNDMPPYSEKVLSDRDVADIHAFLTALPPPPDVKTIPLLRP